MTPNHLMGGTPAKGGKILREDIKTSGKPPSLAN